MVLETYLEHITLPSGFGSGRIEEQDLLRMCEAARWAPSADNQQVWRFIIVESPSTKLAIKKAIEAEDSRLSKVPGTTPIPLTAEDLDRMRWSFDPSNYDPNSDPFRTDLKEAAPFDCACAETAGAFIICTYQPQFLGRAFGEVELGGAVLNLYLLVHKLGYRARIIRNFDHDLVRIACKIPEQVNVQAIIAIGIPLPNQPLPAICKEDEEARIKNGISLVDLMLDRRSIRDYIDKKIPEETIIDFRHILEMIPTFTPQKYIELRLTTDADALQKIAQQARIIFFKQKQASKAPAIASISYKVNGASGYFGKMEVGMAFQVILMEAYSLGLGTCWVGAFHHHSVREILRIPSDWRIEGLLTLGYPKEYPQPPPRLPIANLAFREVWDAPLTSNRVPRFARAGLSSLIRRNFKSTETKTILRERDAGQPLVPAFRELYDSRISRGKMV